MVSRTLRIMKKLVLSGDVLLSTKYYLLVSVLCFLNANFFNSLFETSQSLFWASFGLVDLMAFDLQGIKSFTRFWALLMFGSYSVINIIVLLNMLIAMMSNSYQIISERSDTVIYLVLNIETSLITFSFELGMEVC